jgi:hypothetical protein
VLGSERPGHADARKWAHDAEAVAHERLERRAVHVDLVGTDEVLVGRAPGERQRHRLGLLEEGVTQRDTADRPVRRRIHRVHELGVDARGQADATREHRERGHAEPVIVARVRERVVPLRLGIVDERLAGT